MSDNPRLNQASLLEETGSLISSRLGNSIEKLSVERIVLGLFFSGVKLSNGCGGLCATPVKMIPEAVCCPSSARAMPDSGRLKGKSVLHFMEDIHSKNPLKKTLAIAVMNALSETCRQSNNAPGFDFIVDADPLDFVNIEKESYTLVIGALLPYIKTFKKNGFAYGILELDARTLKEEELPHFIEPDRADEALAKADYLIITGTTLINDTLEDLLARRKETAKAILVGPTASLIPDAFFKRGIISLGGVSVTDADGLLDVIGEAGSGYHFFGKYAEKTVIKY